MNLPVPFSITSTFGWRPFWARLLGRLSGWGAYELLDQRRARE